MRIVCFDKEILSKIRNLKIHKSKFFSLFETLLEYFTGRDYSLPIFVEF